MKDNFLDIAKELNLTIIDDIFSYSFIREKKNVIPYMFAKTHSVLPIEEKDDTIIVAISDPLNLSSIDEISLLLNKKVEMAFLSKQKLEEAIELCYHQKQEDTKLLFAEKKNEKKASTIDAIEDYDLLERSIDNPIIQRLNVMLLEAIQQGASDIHFDPKEDGMRVRYRIDGVLLDKFYQSEEYQMQMVTRLKVMARLDIAEQRLPQDGRIKLKMGKREIDFRVSTIPVVYGERVALRILDRSNILLGLDKLGMPTDLLSNFRKLINFPEGIILVTGPTGSGKTTTLYSVISEINSSEKNIMTIEDPVEYKLKEIAQIGVNPKINLTFARGLRHILRQDPDVIMIGEIRDKETSQIAIQSALTGHLVLSTLHTNDAASSLARLTDMGVEPYLLSSSIIGIIAQRLVRKICPFCRYSYTPTSNEKKDNREIF